MRRLVLFVMLALIAVFSILNFLTNREEKNEIRFAAMGTEAVIIIEGKDAAAHLMAARRKIEELEQKFSIYRTDSEILQINKQAGTGWVKVTADTLEVVRLGQIVSRITDGAFDITRKDFRIIKLDRLNNKVMVEKKEYNIDLGGIGKGYAVQAAAKTLRERGVKKALINMRSSIAAIGGPWKIGICDPRDKSKIIEEIELYDGDALSTSGNYEQGSHITDPKNGRLVKSNGSVTIIARDGGFADALSTGIFVLGQEKGTRLLNSLSEIKAILINSDGKKTKVNF